MSPGATDASVMNFTALDYSASSSPRRSHGGSDAFQSASVKLASAVLLLMTMGAVLSTMFALLLSQYKVTVNPLMAAIPPWVPLVCGLSAVLVGYAYPFVDALVLGRPLRSDMIPGWPAVIRAIGVFLGVSYGASKLSYAFSVQLAFATAVVAVGLWYFFDKTSHGFLLSFIVAVAGTVCVRLFVSSGSYGFVKADFLGVRSWIPCIFFAAGVVFGATGRRLAVYQGLHFGTKLKQ